MPVDLFLRAPEARERDLRLVAADVVNQVFDRAATQTVAVPLDWATLVEGTTLGSFTPGEPSLHSPVESRLHRPEEPTLRRSIDPRLQSPKEPRLHGPEEPTSRRSIDPRLQSPKEP